MKTKTETQRSTLKACCDIKQEQDNIELRMEMPGVSKDSLEVRVDGDLLIVHGEKSVIRPKGNLRLKEIKDGEYHHEFTIDGTIDRNKINAAISNGIVSISLSLKESEKPRKIQVTSA